MSQESLFPVDDIPEISLADRMVHQFGAQAVLLDALGVSGLDQLISGSRYVRVVPKVGARILQLGGKWHSSYPGAPAGDLDFSNRGFSWSPLHETNEVYEGFVYGVTTLDDSASTPIAHLLGHCTDVDTTSFGIPLDDIHQLFAYSQDATDIKGAYQNAQVDGTTYFYQRHRGLPLDVELSCDELEPFVTTYWPDPVLAYTAQ